MSKKSKSLFFVFGFLLLFPIITAGEIYVHNHPTSDIHLKFIFTVLIVGLTAVITLALAAQYLTGAFRQIFIWFALAAFSYILNIIFHFLRDVELYNFSLFDIPSSENIFGILSLIIGMGIVFFLFCVPSQLPKGKHNGEFLYFARYYIYGGIILALVEALNLLNLQNYLGNVYFYYIQYSLIFMAFVVFIYSSSKMIKFCKAHPSGKK